MDAWLFIPLARRGNISFFLVEEGEEINYVPSVDDESFSNNETPKERDFWLGWTRVSKMNKYSERVINSMMMLFSRSR